MKRYLIPTAVLALVSLTAFAGAQDWESLTSINAADISGSQTPMPEAAAPSRDAAARPLICVDPGHPNTFNSGNAVQNGTTETHINWVVARRLETLLKDAGYDVMLTRAVELQPVENKERALMCNRAGAALAVHLHCDAVPDSGFAIYYPDRIGTYDYNDDPDNGFRGPSAGVRTGSQALAAAMGNGMTQTLTGVLDNRGVFGDSRTAVGGRQGALTFSIFSQIPTITIEMVVLTNRNDAAFIKTADGQDKMARAIAAGIQLYRAP